MSSDRSSPGDGGDDTSAGEGGARKMPGRKVPGWKGLGRMEPRGRADRKGPGEWRVPEGWTSLRTLDVHAGGEPLRIVLDGIPELSGETILEKRRHLREHHDHLRTALLWEPRGHPHMYGCVPTAPTTPDGTLGVVFLHTSGYSTMCGHGVIGLVTAGVEAGWWGPAGDEGQDPEIRLDTPAGRVVARAHLREGRVEAVSFRNVPSFVEAEELRVEVEGVGEVRCDLVFGGAFYAVCRGEELGLRVVPEESERIVDLGRRVKQAASDAHEIRHPGGEEELDFLYGTIIVEEARDPAHHSRNACVFGDGELDRCPTGTGVSGRAALHHRRGELELNEPFVVESILGTTFTGRVLEEVRIGDRPAVLPEVTGSAHIVGLNRWLLDPRDPLRHGFFLR